MRLLITLFAFSTFLVALSFAAVMGLYAFYARELPDPSELARRQVFQTARILDRHGALIEELVDPEGGRRTLVRLDQVPKSLRDATIAAEDASFYANPGFDPRAIVRAVWQYVRTGAPQSGASTITQQLVKNTLLSPEQTPERKIKEAFLAMELTRRYSKDQILEMYLNEIPYGNRAYGIEAAAETYFGKPARDLSLAEASFLAGLPQAPSYYDPYQNMAAAKERQAYVLEQMVRTRAATQSEADAALRAPLPLRPRQVATPLRAPHFATYVRQVLEQELGAEALYRNGLQVTTSLDLTVQDAAEQAVREGVAAIRERGANNGSLVALRPGTGEILAMVGSANFEDASIDGQVNVALAERQPGSTLKPFTYLAAFAKGWNPATMMMDVPTTFGGNYRPNNFDNQFRGPVRVRDALAQSLNIPAVKALEFVGIGDLLDHVHRMGIQGLRQPERYGLSLTLGGGEVRLLDLTYAYAALANGGRQVGAQVPPERRQPGFREFEPVAILKIADASGKVLAEYTPPPGVDVADRRLVYQVTSILSDNQARIPTFGRDNPLQLPDRPAAVKTGTTDNYRDAWMVGYTPDLVAGVWVGNTDNQPMRDVGGSVGAGRIWNAFMVAATRGTPVKPFVAPEGVVQADVCALSGLLPTPECEEASGIVRDVFVPGVNLPTKPDDMHERVEVCLVNGKRVVPHVPPNGRENRVFFRFPEPYAAWATANGYPAAPTELCDDVYKGERIAQVISPTPSDRVVVGDRVQVVGSAWIDDFQRYSLEVGQSASPTDWMPLTIDRHQAVDSALLGVWETAGLQPGPYVLRLTVVDSLGNFVQGQSTVSLTPPPTPTPTPTAVPTPASPAATAVPAPQLQPTAGGQATPPPAAKPTSPVATSAPAKPAASPTPGR